MMKRRGLIADPSSRPTFTSTCSVFPPPVPQEKRSKNKHLSKEAFRQIRYKQNMWRVYKHTGKDKDYAAYKEALNAATNEVRKSKRNIEHKLAPNIKSDSKSFYAYVRSKQNVRDRVGPLEDNARNNNNTGSFNGRGTRALLRLERTMNSLCH